MSAFPAFPAEDIGGTRQNQGFRHPHARAVGTYGATVPEPVEGSAMTTTRFLSLFGGLQAFQTFDDLPRKLPGLSRILHGSLTEHAGTLAELNARGAGVFFMVNAGDGKGRKAGNVQQVRALFVDLDGSPLEPVRDATLPPHCIVESSPGRWHAYWRIADCPLDRFKPLQQALARRFDADPKVCDLPRVMRLPGFDHCKREPYTSRIVTLDADRPAYRVAELVSAFGLDAAPVALPVHKRRTLPGTIPAGERNGTLLSLAAGLVRKGHDAPAVNDRLQRINAERCQPPLCASEVDAIAAQASGYGSEGFMLLTHKLLDSPEWRALPPPAHDVILTAFRRFDGFNNGNIALTWVDFEGRPGFGDKHTFYRHRSRALASGILLARPGKSAQRGRTADLFRIADRWLPEHLVCKTQPCASVQIAYPYIDKQDVVDFGLEVGTSRKQRDTKPRAA